MSTVGIHAYVVACLQHSARFSIIITWCGSRSINYLRGTAARKICGLLWPAHSATIMNGRSCASEFLRARGVTGITLRGHDKLCFGFYIASQLESPHVLDLAWTLPTVLSDRSYCSFLICKQTMVSFECNWAVRAHVHM